MAHAGRCSAGRNPPPSRAFLPCHAEELARPFDSRPHPRGAARMGGVRRRAGGALSLPAAMRTARSTATVATSVAVMLLSGQAQAENEAAGAHAANRVRLVPPRRDQGKAAKER